MEQTVKDIRSLRLSAFIIGMIGSLAVLFSLITDSYEVQSVVGSIALNNSATFYLSSFYYLVIAVAACGIVFTVMRAGIANIITGIICIVPGIYLYSDIRSKSDFRTIAVHIGPMVYLMIIGGTMIFISGIIIKFAKIKIKEIGLEEDNTKFKKYAKLAYPGLALLCALCIGLTSFSIVTASKEKKKAKSTVIYFLNAGLNADYNTMITYLDDNVDDKNGLMEAYTPGVIGSAYLSALGLEYDSLGSAGKETVDAMEKYFSQSYLKSFNIKDVKGTNGVYTVTATGTILKFRDDDDAYEKGYELGQQIVNDFVDGSTKTTAKGMLERYLPDIVNIMIDSIRNSGKMETEFTFKVEKKNGKFLITEIDYED